jgi:RiboL-PSP-HEPN
LKQALHELEVWKIADRGWKKYLGDQLGKLREERNRQINTPKKEQIDLLFRQAVGIAEISLSWKWKKMAVSGAAGKLDKYVTMRGDIAHRGKGTVTVKKAQVEDYFDFIKNLAAKTGGAVNSHVKQITRKPLWS